MSVSVAEQDLIIKQVASLIKKKGLPFTEVAKRYLGAWEATEIESDILQKLFDSDHMSGISWKPNNNALPAIGVHHCIGVSFKIWLTGFFHLIPTVVAYRGKAQRGDKVFGTRTFGRCVIHWLMFSSVFYYPILTVQREHKATKAEISMKLASTQDQVDKLTRQLKSAQDKLVTLERYAKGKQYGKLRRFFGLSGKKDEGLGDNV